MTRFCKGLWVDAGVEMRVKVSEVATGKVTGSTMEMGEPKSRAVESKPMLCKSRGGARVFTFARL